MRDGSERQSPTEVWPCLSVSRTFYQSTEGVWAPLTRVTVRGQSASRLPPRSAQRGRVRVRA
eukprot:1481434-Prymnesium_polylepis.1